MTVLIEKPPKGNGYFLTIGESERIQNKWAVTGDELRELAKAIELVTVKDNLNGLKVWEGGHTVMWSNVQTEVKKEDKILIEVKENV